MWPTESKKTHFQAATRPGRNVEQPTFLLHSSSLCFHMFPAFLVVALGVLSVAYDVRLLMTVGVV
jgi:hypothetical protein